MPRTRVSLNSKAHQLGWLKTKKILKRFLITDIQRITDIQHIVLHYIWSIVMQYNMLNVSYSLSRNECCNAKVTEKYTAEISS